MSDGAARAPVVAEAVEAAMWSMAGSLGKASNFHALQALRQQQLTSVVSR